MKLGKVVVCLTFMTAIAGALVQGQSYDNIWSTVAGSSCWGEFLLRRDAAGNTYLVGAQTTASKGVFLQKYSPTGTLLYQRFRTRPGNPIEKVKGLAVNGAQEIFLATEDTSAHSVLTTKFDSGGNPVTVQSFGGGATPATCTGLGVDSGSGVYVCGSMGGANPNGFFVKYNVNLAFAFSKTIDLSGGSDQIDAMAVTPGGKLYTIGRSHNGITLGILCRQFDGNGISYWDEFYPKPAAVVRGACVTRTGGILYCGSVPVGNQGDNALVRCLTPAGTSVFSKAHNSTGTTNDVYLAVGTDGNDRLAVTGRSGFEQRVASLNSATGDIVHTWNTSTIGWPGTTAGTSIAVDPFGGISTAGENLRQADGLTYHTIAHAFPGNSNTSGSFWFDGYSTVQGSNVLTDGDGRVYYARLQSSGSVRINCDDPRPVAVPDSLNAVDGTLLVGSSPGVLGNDRYTRFASATLTAVSLHGTVDLAPDGSYTYLPDTGYIGPDTFKYRLDGLSASSPEVTVTITVAKLALRTLSVSPNPFVGGNNITGTITLTGNPNYAKVVTLSDNTALIATPASLNIPSGASSGQFICSTSTVTLAQPRTITASYNGSTLSTTIVQNPPVTRIYSILSSALSLKGGTSAIGTVKLNMVASGNKVVILASTGGPLFVPANATVLNGQQQRDFTITTAVTASTLTRTMSGTFGGVTKTLTLTITP